MTNPKHTDTSRSGDLVERLRERTCVVFNSPGVHPDTECLEAADRIEALEAENERLWAIVKDAHSILSECKVTFGVCACGEDMETHGERRAEIIREQERKS